MTRRKMKMTRRKMKMTRTRRRRTTRTRKIEFRFFFLDPYGEFPDP